MVVSCLVEMLASDRVAFECDGTPVDVTVPPGASLLDVLREELGIRSVKDGCAPQGQCGCCTVLVDGAPRVACVTPAARVGGRSVTTVDGLAPELRDRLAAAFLACGGSQCGFCTPGIVVRAAWLLERDEVRDVDVDRMLAAHLCRCTGWNTVREAIHAAAAGTEAAPARDLDTAARRAALEGGVDQRVAADVPLGAGGFADDTAPAAAAVAVPDAAGGWVVAPSLAEARARAGKVQGRRTTAASRPPLALPPCPPGGVRLATSWVEPAYLEPDASWCEPGGAPASPVANGGAFGGKLHSIAPHVARELADHHSRPVRVVLAREDVVRLGPKRPPIAAASVVRDGVVHIEGSVVGDVVPELAGALPYELEVDADWRRVQVAGPPTSPELRAWPLAELTVLVEGALAAAGVDRAALVRDDRTGAVLLDASAADPRDGAVAGARVVVRPGGRGVERVEVRVAAGDPLDDVVLRSYCIGAAHMALGWVLSEGIAVDPETGEVLDLTIRSFGILRAQDTPPIEVTVIDDPGPPRAHASDAVFAAAAAATWNAITAATGTRPETFPCS
ncbi:MAG TPA: 2Fe-2S iron-sulfur cluster-binding protein [Acidimicrobiia bacterium]|jgi:aerobic-type carbon monoxide dehydrogenase small subunit (CoxS/CutS family)